MKRPRGVTAFAVLLAISGVADIQQGLLMIGTTPDDLGSTYGNVPLFEIFRNAWWITLSLTLPIGLLTLVTVKGLLSGNSWAWYLWLIISTVGIVVGVVNLPMGSANLLTGLVYSIILFLDIVAIYYLTRTRIRAYFGKT